MWETRQLELTDEQKMRGVVYSSILYADNGCEPVLHEVMADDPMRLEHIANLEDVEFFKNMARDFGWNVINIVRR